MYQQIFRTTYIHCAVPENIHTHPKEGHWKFRGGGVSKAKIFKGKYDAKLEIPGGSGRGVQPKNLPWVRYGYILEPHIVGDAVA